MRLKSFFAVRSMQIRGPRVEKSNLQVTKSFSRVEKSNLQVTKSFSQVEKSNLHVTKSFFQMETSNLHVKIAFLTDKDRFCIHGKHFRNILLLSTASN